ncbi:response regulator transcription factor [Kocuria sp.]|uniref:response regulator transcription factor n=1 Tax=Kocuria sp. TaxID=1871328 RepID=UPI0026DEC873|nr:response regulator transcription factor [Kocuria sp.]MDO5617278.1 response regulator transcription factor [Kocuria sp.]
MTTSIRLLLADDQALVRGALAALLSLEDDLEVVAQTGTGSDVVEMVRAHQVDVALLDIEMPGRDGIDTARAIRDAGVPCRSLVVTTFGRPGYLRRALEAGASGFVVKDTPADELAAAVRSVHAGQRMIDPSLAEESLVSGNNPLTVREQDVLRAALSGRSIKELAAQLCLSPGTVRNHLSSAIGKTQTTNRAEAAQKAQRNGWL